ncbi:MAG: type IV pili methyl-accepting chemotaxis transducer N-terminal domain-containing protein [Rubrivivax sp.]|nr:type IV pili methyl-accepting chemotaxis transducer N-terminal domain-containing protein [Rubrivivax sp.]
MVGRRSLSRRCWCLGAAAVLALRPAAAQVRDLNDAINKAGRQRMLSQRCAKAWLALGQQVRPDLADKVLAESMALFERQLAELRAFAPAPALRATYEQLDVAWTACRTTLVGAPPARAGAEAMLAVAARVLALADEGTQQLEQLSGRPLGRLVNIAGRQRMLSQRMAALYLGASWGVQPAAAVQRLEQARGEFTQAMALLKAAPEATTAIRAELELADQQYSFFDSALRSLKAGAADGRAQADVFTTSERILQVMEGVTGQFARLG